MNISFLLENGNYPAEGAATIENAYRAPHEYEFIEKKV